MAFPRSVPRMNLLQGVPVGPQVEVLGSGEPSIFPKAR